MGLVEGVWGLTNGSGARTSGERSATEMMPDRGDIAGLEVQGDVTGLRD